MKFKVDENLPAEIRDDLRDMGHDADLVSDEGLTGAPDEVLLEHVRREKRIFSRWTKVSQTYGHTLQTTTTALSSFALPRRAEAPSCPSVRRHLPALLQLEVDGRLLVVTDRSVRMR